MITHFLQQDYLLYSNTVQLGLSDENIRFVQTRWQSLQRGATALGGSADSHACGVGTPLRVHSCLRRVFPPAALIHRNALPQISRLDRFTTHYELSYLNRIVLYPYLQISRDVALLRLY